MTSRGHATRINGERRQHDLLFRAVQRGLGGTGLTPEGCTPASYLQPGDEIVSEIDVIGSIAALILD
jgi:hypothetical protein